MEDVLDVYHAPYDPQFPLVCMDESNKQLVGEVHAPLPLAPGCGQIIDHEYVRNGVADIFLEVEPLRGRRHVEITEQRTRKDWAMFVKGMLDERYPQAIKVRLVMDNLNTHSAASLYEGRAQSPSATNLKGIMLHGQVVYASEFGRALFVANAVGDGLESGGYSRRTPAGALDG